MLCPPVSLSAVKPEQDERLTTAATDEDVTKEESEDERLRALSCMDKVGVTASACWVLVI